MKKNIPKIRFKGFTDAWEQRKLGEISDKVTKKNKNTLVEEVFTNSAEFGIISQRDFFDKDIANSENIDGYYIVKPNDFVYNPRISTTAPFGPIKRNKLERAGAMSPLYYVFKSHDINLDYLEWFFQTTCWHAFMRFNGNSGARSDRFAISDKIFKELPISIPKNTNEQKNIGTLLTELDLFITLHQRKCEQLKTFKKSMLEKMFPKNGKNIPEVRFKGFIDDWEQRKLGEISVFSKGNGYSKNDLTEEGTPIILYGSLYTKYNFFIDKVDTFTTPSNISVYSQGNEVLVPASGETSEDIARASAIEKPGIIIGGDLNIIRPLDFVDPRFLALVLSNGEAKKQLIKKAQGKSVVHIRNSDIKSLFIIYPKKIEQEKIITEIRKLDKLITLYQRKVEKLENIKKSLLEKMFV